MDIKQKVCFKRSTDNLQLSDYYDEEQSDLVVADKFWYSVLRGFSRQNSEWQAVAEGSGCEI